MTNTLQLIISEASKTKPEYGEYKDHKIDPFTHGISVTTTTNYTLGVSKELIDEFEKGIVDNESLINRIKIKRSPETK